MRLSSSHISLESIPIIVDALIMIHKGNYHADQPIESAAGHEDGHRFGLKPLPGFRLTGILFGICGRTGK